MLGTLGSARTKIRFFPPSGLPVCVFARKGCVVCPGSAFEMTPRITQQKKHQKSVYSAKVSAEANPCKPRSPKRVDLDEENKYTRLRGPRLPATRTTETLYHTVVVLRSKPLNVRAQSSSEPQSESESSESEPSSAARRLSSESTRPPFMMPTPPPPGWGPGQGQHDR